MNINCVICSDLFSPSDEIYCTPCGHVFHQACLLQWIERSSTCPQCRKKTTEKNICKIYFNFMNTDGITLDAGSLQVQLDNAEFQVRQKDKDINTLKDEIKKIEKKAAQTDEQLLSTKEKLKTKEVALTGLKEQVDYLKVECKEISQLRLNNDKLQKQIDLMKGLEEVIYGTASEVQSMVNNSQDVSKLCTYVVVLKRAVMDSESKKKLARDSLHAVQNQMSRIVMEKQDLQTRVVSLEESLSHSEDEIKQLKSCITDLENKKVVKEDILQSSGPHNGFSESVKRKSDFIDEEANKKVQFKSLNHTYTKPSTSRASTLEENINNKPTRESSSPYLTVKQCSNPILHLKKSVSVAYSNSSKANEFSIFKGSRLTEKMKSERDVDILKKMFNKKPGSEMDYDGLGGHSKLDVFPIAKKIITNPATRKPSMKSIMQRVERPPNQKTLDEAFIKFS